MIKINRVLLFVSMLLILNCDVMAEQPKVCFYANEYYVGDSFCAAEVFFSIHFFLNGMIEFHLSKFLMA
ncbi:hypothetical protein [Yersinia bercovieri]|uniref:hypothetical protein n=1 Tax=Yersinia bercovieri TaxID=634 RepID=UPI0021BDB2D5|nr:hypothetical protein [Yersinia bercovieri]